MTVCLLLLSALAADAPVDFDNHVIPILTKSGCNTGACHGAAVGRGGFRLSLYGGDPAADYQSIVMELEGRRVNLAKPDESLLILKPTESITHGGGYRLEFDGEGADRLRRWVEQGANRQPTRKLTSLSVTPETFTATAPGESVELKAEARFDDGSTVDVTSWTVFTAEDKSAVEIDEATGVAQIHRRGRHIVIARYLNQVLPVEILVPLADQPVDHSDTPRFNFIDEEIVRVLSVLRIPASPACDDATFLRRVTLDLTGRLPTPEASRDFQADTRPDKRSRLVDALLSSEEFNEYWALQWAKLLRIRSQPNEANGAQAYYNWLKAQIASHAPYDQMAATIILATGDTHEVGPANFYRTVRGAREQAEFTSELFMGNRLRCANCHNHPLDRWTQDDYHGLAAIFARMTNGRVIEVSPRGEVMHPRTGSSAVPRIPGERFLQADDVRQELVDWLIAQDNPYFAKAVVNRLWKLMMGRGLVEPTDDLRDTNPATHPALLNQLSSDFVEHGYDLRHTLRRIAASASYARSAQVVSGNETDDRYYSHSLRRSLQPEVLADAISDVLGVAGKYGKQPAGTRAVSLFDAKIESAALDILGRCSREESCENVDQAIGGLPRKLHLLNGELLNQRIGDSSGRLMRLLEDEQQTGIEIVHHFYELALSRSPRDEEIRYWNDQLQRVQGRENQQTLMEDFVWSLLTCQEFVTNH